MPILDSALHMNDSKNPKDISSRDPASQAAPSDSDERPVLIAIVGAGPAGFYAAGHLLKEGGERIEVDMFERLPTPHGLVRSGVAPDHPKIKSVTRVYEKTAAHPRFRYFGNVELGRELSCEELRKRYHAVVYATGAPADRPLGIPGEQFAGSWAATDFVGWYNGHPDYRDLEFDLSGRRAVVVGNGNVALDVARMLMLSHAELSRTDMANHALDVLEHSRIEEVVVVGRRGPAQAAFTNPELLELSELEDVDVVVDSAELERALAVADTTMDATATRNVAELRRLAAHPPRSGAPRRIVLRFLLSPVELLDNGASAVAGVRLAHNELVAADNGGALRARATGEQEVLAAELVLRAIGYRGTALAGVPFDERSGVIANANGRVVEAREGGATPDAQSAHGRVRTGEYAVGWIKRGPTGVIGTNKKDAQETVDAIFEDLAAGRLADPPLGDAAQLERLLRERQPDLVTYAGWTSIDRHERLLGEPLERPRVKLTSIEEMLEVATEQTPAASP
jgi:ferredoxin--NADP+ reductase